MKSKKGVVSIQFNWVFILIAGAAILLFFFSVVQWQKKASESKVNVAVLTNLDTIFTGVKTTESSTNIITIPKTEVSFDCNNYFIGSTKKQIKARTIFSPDLIKGTRILTHTLSWNAPFKITNFLYLTSPQIRYILVEDPTIPPSGNLLSDINKSLPPKYMKLKEKQELAMNKEIWDKFNLDVQDENNYKVKFIFFNTGATGPELDTALNNLANMPDADVTAIEINEPDEIKFYQKDGSTFSYKGTSYYLGKEAIIAAIFSENSEMYNCSIQKAFKQLAITSKIYHNRSFNLMNHYLDITPKNYPCASHHTKAAQKLDTISAHSEQISEGVDVKNEAERLVGDISELQFHNNNANINSCVLVY